MGSVASGRTSLDHRGDSPEMEKPGWRYPAGRDTSRCVKDARDLKNDIFKLGNFGKRESAFCVIEMINHLIALLVLAMTGVLDLSSSL